MSSWIGDRLEGGESDWLGNGLEGGMQVVSSVQVGIIGSAR